MAAAITRGSARFSSNHAWNALKAGSSSSSGSVSSGNAGTQATSARRAAIWTARTSRSLSASGYSTLAPSASPRRPLWQSRQDLRSCLYPSALGRQGSCPSVFHFVRRSYADGPSPPSPTDERAEKAKDKQAVGPFNARAAVLFIATGVGLFFYFQSEKAAVEERKRLESEQARVGRPRIGGPFELMMPTPASNADEANNVEGRRFTHEDLQGAFTLIYFGFTNCPDICPEELDKMAQIVSNVDAKHGPVINPVFITCDPARDNLAATAIYVSEFHPRLVGLTGSYEAIKNACKQYRVYFSTPPGADPSGDYLVDHSIFFYLMDPDGKFVDAFGRSVDAREATGKVMGFIDQWVAAGNPIAKADAKDRVVQDTSRRV